MYKPEHFIIQEWVPPTVYEQWGERAWQFIDDRALITADQMREHFGPMFINTWFSDRLIEVYKLRQWCGLRTVGFFQEVYGDVEGLEKYFASFSQHKFGRAWDAIFRDVSAEEVRQEVIRNKQLFPHLTAIEDKVSWFHGDVRNVEPLMVFDP